VNEEPLPPASVRRVVLFACSAAAVVTTGFQGIAPALPATQDALGLSDAQVAAVTTAYLMPSVLVGIPAGLLSDRYGRRVVMSTALVVYGTGGLVLLLWHTLPALLCVRALQGAAFGAVLGLTITLIGDVVSASGQVRAQGRRIVWITIGEALFPMLSGVVVAVAWFAPYALTALALPLGIWGAVALPATPPEARGRAPLRGVVVSLRDPGIAGLQSLAFMRFFLKFTLVTYYPIVAVREADMSASSVGVVIGAASLLGAATAVLVGRLPVRVSLTAVMGVAVVVEVAAMAAVGEVPVIGVLVVAMLLFGTSDGALAVAHNAVVTNAVGRGARASFVALTGTVRNLGKLSAPVVSGALALVLPIGTVLTVVAGAGAVLGSSVLAVRRAEQRGRAPGTWTESPDDR
jgi:MFS family permease